MKLKDFKKELFGKLTPGQKEMIKREEAKFKAKCSKYKKNGGKYCRHEATIGEVDGPKMMCLICGKVVDNPDNN